MSGLHIYPSLDILLPSLGSNASAFGFLQAGNEGYRLSSGCQQFRSLYILTDKDPPRITGIAISPHVVNTTNAAASITIEFRFSDDVRTIIFVSLIRLLTGMITGKRCHVVQVGKEDVQRV